MVTDIPTTKARLILPTLSDRRRGYCLWRLSLGCLVRMFRFLLCSLLWQVLCPCLACILLRESYPGLIFRLSAFFWLWNRRLFFLQPWWFPKLVFRFSFSYFSFFFSDILIKKPPEISYV